MQNLPTHIAFIMDGNRRWAKRRGLPRDYGHRKGAEVLVDTIKNVANIKQIKFASFFAFSTENWKRDESEISAIFSLVDEVFSKFEKDFQSQDIRFKMVGDLSKLSPELQQKLIKIEENSKNNDGLTVLVALSYGGREDVVFAVNKLIKAGKNAVTSEDIAKNLQTACAPDIDFLIRTSGEMRLSNFMLYKLAYSELYFPKYAWPSFNKKRLLKALKIYKKRNRRFGGN